ncbi:hypothetical protein ABIF38_008828 [Bradyrhizobium japonicum]|jgi:hypothetical protein|nr:hypothetical protein [Bradyrhizobium elkanii]MCS4007312.1 hypothetical protein [Bradyrhizobium elkanii USDA 61]MCP1929362.1 hypothetical protein [Bradyrhizobium elkanii]MCS3473317.1 hypothetical protein [Bradyrhizobium elkanii]MCS3572978.1 hypothetical protein [Bradyrhizobium elkanii]
MTKKTKRRPAKGGTKAGANVLFATLSDDPATNAIADRVARCNKPPLKWLRQADGSWLECSLRSDCTYGNCHEVSANEVPAEIRNA